MAKANKHRFKLLTPHFLVVGDVVLPKDTDWTELTKVHDHHIVLSNVEYYHAASDSFFYEVKEAVVQTSSIISFAPVGDSVEELQALRQQGLKVSELMSSNVLTALPDDTVHEAARLMVVNRVRHLPVMAGQKLVGLITDRDARVYLGAEYQDKRVSEVMVKNPLTVGPTESAKRAARLMVERKIGCLPVEKLGKLVGVLTETDVMRYFVEIV